MRWGRWTVGMLVLVTACASPPAARPPRPAAQPVAQRDTPSALRAGRPQVPESHRDEGPVAPLALAPLRRAARAAKPPEAPRLGWPIEGGVVSSPYGRRGRRHHDGIDISVPYGTRVLAAADGEVVFDGWLRGYGRMLIVRHERGFVSVYAHNARHAVAKGARVRRGQHIARVGRTGRTSGVVLHFEVRKDNVAYDPLALLPQRDAVAAREE